MIQMISFKRVFPILILLLLVSLYANAAKISGNTLDSKGEILPYTTIVVEENNISIVSNGEGYYEITLPKGDYVLTATSLNYVPTSEFINLGEEDINLNFTLINREYELKDVEISSKMEDLGVRIMRKVISNRKKHSETVNTLIADVYLKGNLGLIKVPDLVMGLKLDDDQKEQMGVDSLGKGILYLLEQNTTYYYQKPNKTFNKIRSVRQSGDSKGLGFEQMPSIINVYENNIDIINGLNSRGFISPASTNALSYYDFKFEGGFEEKGYYVNKIKVIPKRKFEPLFSGYVFVIDDLWLFSAVDLMLTKESGMDMLDTLRLQQNYRPYKGSENWVILNQTLQPSMSMMGFHFGGAFVTNYSNLLLNETIPFEIFNQKYVSEYDSSALKKEANYWDSVRSIPLTDLEQKDFIKKDSLELVRIEKDSIYNSLDHYNFLAINVVATGMKYFNVKNEWKLNSLLDMVQFNHIEGLNISLKPSYTYKINGNESIGLKWKTRYGFVSQSWYNSAHFNWSKKDNSQPARMFSFNLAGGRYINDIHNKNPLTEYYNTYLALFGDNYMKFYESDFLKFNWNHKLGNGFQYGFSVNWENRKPLENNTTFTFNDSKNIESNIPSGLHNWERHKALVISSTLSYQPGWKYVKYPNHVQAIPSSLPLFSLNYEKGLKVDEWSDVNFDKWNFNISHKLKMGLAGQLDYNVGVGGFLNKDSIGIMDLNLYRGNQIWLANNYLESFQMMPYYEFANSENFYFNGHVEWHLKGLLSNKIPLFKQLNWHFVLGGNYLYLANGRSYQEAFFGIENIGYKMFRFGRVDFITRIPEKGEQMYYGVKIGLNSSLLNITIE